MFTQLPGKPLKEFAKSVPHGAMAWQTFRDTTFVAYGIRNGDAYPDKTIEISRDSTTTWCWTTSEQSQDTWTSAAG